jgi:hypothetical protein
MQLLGKISEEQQAATRYWLSVKADKARRATRQAAWSPLAGMLRTLVGAFGTGRSVLAATAHGPEAK